MHIYINDAIRYTKDEEKALSEKNLRKLTCGKSPTFNSKCRVADDAACGQQTNIGYNREAGWTPIFASASGEPCGAFDGEACLAEVSIDITPEMAGANAKLFAFFITEDGEVVPDEIDLGLASQLKTKLSVKIDDKKEFYAPGDDVTVTVTSEAAVEGATLGTSLLGLAAIDKSILLLRSQEALTAGDVLADQAKALEDNGTSRLVSVCVCVCLCVYTMCLCESI